MLEIEIHNAQSLHPVDAPRLQAAIRSLLDDEGVRAGVISLAVVDDQAIQQLNDRFLGHDRPTDVLSFLLDRQDDRLEGEVIVSAETASACASRFGWSTDDELLLYVTHGLLHLVGYDDQTPRDRHRMRNRERHHLARLGLEPAYEHRKRPGHRAAGDRLQ